MAFVSIQHVLIDNYEGAAGMLAGSAVALTDDGGTPTVVKADRANSLDFFGILADDTTDQGNTQAVVDPVAYGNYSHDSSDGITLPDYYGPEFVKVPARRLGDYKDERITNVNNWTDYPSEPKRGVAVYRNGGRFKTDQFDLTQVTDTATTDVAYAGAVTVGTVLTIGADTNAGLLIVRDPSTPADGEAVATVVNPATATGLLEIALV